MPPAGLQGSASGVLGGVGVSYTGEVIASVLAPQHASPNGRSPLVTLELPATDHQIIIGQDCDYLVGQRMAHAFSKEGLFIVSGPVPTFLKGEKAQASLQPLPRRDGLRP